MTRNTIKKQITSQYLSIKGTSFINHEYLLGMFGLKPQAISHSLIDIGLHYMPNDIILIGDQPNQQTYISFDVLKLLRRWQPDEFADSSDALSKYAVVCDRLLRPESMPSYDHQIAEWSWRYGKSVLPSVMALGDFNQGNAA